MDNYALHAASAIAGVSSFRAFAGFGFPLFADKLYESVGYGRYRIVAAWLDAERKTPTSQVGGTQFLLLSAWSLDALLPSYFIDMAPDYARGARRPRLNNNHEQKSYSESL